MAAVLLGVVAALSWSVHDLIARSFAIRIGPVRMAIAVMILGGLLMTFLIIYRGTIWQATAVGILQSLLLGVAYGMGVGGQMAYYLVFNSRDQRALTFGAAMGCDSGYADGCRSGGALGP